MIAESLGSLPGVEPEDVAYPAPERYRHDLWPVALKRGAGTATPALVLPRSTEGVAEIVRWAVEHGCRVAAYGAGTNVVGALDGEVDVLIGLERLDAIHELDSESQIVTVGAGLNGGVLEDHLEEHGFTLGHYPQSLRISTVGGWVAMRASGTYSTGYGGIERMVRGLEVVLPDGTLVRVAPRVRPPGGLDLVGLLTGSEGSLGIVTAVSLDIRRRADEETVCASFDTMAVGLAAQRELVQCGYRVALLRLYNAAESAVLVSEELRGSVRCLLVARVSGPGELCTAEARAVAALLERLGGTLLPQEAAAPWFARRFAADGLMERANAEPGRMFDTIEVSVPWRTAAACADALETALGRRCDPFYLHASHAYGSGACLYLMLHLTGPDDETVLHEVTAAWDEALAIVERHDGAIGHHHGIGTVRGAAYRATPEGAVHARLRAALDPAGVLHAPLLDG